MCDVSSGLCPRLEIIKFISVTNSETVIKMIAKMIAKAIVPGDIRGYENITS